MVNASQFPDAATQAATFWQAPVPFAEVAGNDLAPKAEAVHAVINHGRWVVSCPDCNGAQLATPDDPRFMCCECANIAIEGLWRPMVWPKQADKIAALIDERTDRARQNYEPGETLKQLREQNAALASGAVR